MCHLRDILRSFINLGLFMKAIKARFRKHYFLFFFQWYHILYIMLDFCRNRKNWAMEIKGGELDFWVEEKPITTPFACQQWNTTKFISFTYQYNIQKNANYYKSCNLLFEFIREKWINLSPGISPRILRLTSARNLKIPVLKPLSAGKSDYGG